MSDEWMPSLRLNLTPVEFEALPRHPAFKYEMINGETRISPRPRYANARLELRRFRPDASDVATATLRPVQASDLDALVPVFLGGFGQLQPFGSLSGERARAAAVDSLSYTFAGKDGPVAWPASFVAMQDDRPVGAIIVTLLPGGDECDWGSMHWHDPPPADLWETHQGQPHLTWIFVQRFEQGEGIGTQLLKQAVSVLKKHKYTSLWSTFMIGNDSSLRWHWRNGFVLQPNTLSKRRLRVTISQRKK